MNKTSRIIVTVAVAIVLAVGGGAVGYQIGAANENVNAAQDAQCAAIAGFDLTPIAPFKAVTPACVWPYQIGLTEALQRGPDACYCK